MRYPVRASPSEVAEIRPSRAFSGGWSPTYRAMSPKTRRNLSGRRPHCACCVGEAVPQLWRDDLDLATRCVAGERAAQRTLYEREKRRVHATLYRVFGSNHHIDDVIQEVFLQVFRSLGGFRGDSSLRTWIDRCAVRVAYVHLTKDKRRGPSLELVADIPSGDPSAERRTLAREAARRLYAALELLEPKQRIAFTLHRLDGIRSRRSRASWRRRW